MFGNYTFDDLVVDELLVTSYEFNSDFPRFYSKWFSRSDPGRQNVFLKKATQASSSAPIYFDPTSSENKYH